MRRIIAVVIVACASVAFAQVPPTKAAEETFTRGRELMKAKQYAQACAAFEESQRLDPQYGTQYNLAGCYVELGRLVAALDLYRELSRSDTNPDRREASAGEAAKLATRVPKLAIRISGDKPASLTLDGVDALGYVGLDAPVDLGKHVLVAAAPGHKTLTREVIVASEGKTSMVMLTLEAAEDAAPVAPVARPASSRATYGKIATFAGAGVAVLGLGFGAVAYVKNRDAKDLYDPTDPASVPKANDKVAGARKFGNASTAFVIVGLAAAAAGGFLWATAPRAEDATVVTMSPLDNDAAGVVIAGHF